MDFTGNIWCACLQLVIFLSLSLTLCLSLLSVCLSLSPLSPSDERNLSYGGLGCCLVMHSFTMIRTASLSRMEKMLSRLFKNFSGYLIKFDALLHYTYHSTTSCSNIMECFPYYVKSDSDTRSSLVKRNQRFCLF